MTQQLERLLTTDEVAELLGVPVATLYQWRMRGDGPPSMKVGRFVRYERADVRAWLDEQRRPRRVT